MRDPELPEYLGKAALPGVGKQWPQDRTRTLTRQAPIVRRAARGELFALFDGMGSKGQGGADAAELMCDMVTDFFRKPQQIPATSEGLQQLLLQGNHIINSWGTAPDTGKCIGGCVGSVLWIYQEEAYVFHAGDTGVFCIADNMTRRLTPRHCDEQGLITSFFGMGQKLQMHVQKLSLEQIYFIIILSDGIADRISLEDIANIVSSKEAYQSAKDFVSLANKRKATDDLTAIVIDVGEVLFCAP